MASTTKKTTITRPLHWVIKSRDLRATVDFYSQVLGFRVLRHEEFFEGCEATCNGKYGGAWSKTMLGARSEHDGFCLEIIFNWGVENYEPRGNAFRRIKVRDDGKQTRENRAREWWSQRNGKASLGDHTTQDADGNTIEFIPLESTEYTELSEDILVVSLSVSDVARSAEFYINAFKGTDLPRSLQFGSIPEEASRLVRFGPQGTVVELVEVQRGVEVVQGEAQGRFATQTEDGEPDALAKRAGSEHVIHG